MKKTILYILYIVLSLNAMSQGKGNGNADTVRSHKLEDVIVTANKREESIIKVNTSITSLSSKKSKIQEHGD